jgi:hypothetical protein
MNPMHQNDILAFAEKCYVDENPFALEMRFRYMSNTEIRKLLSSTNTWSSDTLHVRLVADCMLRYYYNRYEKTYGYISWEDADGMKTEPADDFHQKRKYWERVRDGMNLSQYPYVDEDQEQRPRFFSRDATIHE